MPKALHFNSKTGAGSVSSEHQAEQPRTRSASGPMAGAGNGVPGWRNGRGPAPGAGVRQMSLPHVSSGPLPEEATTPDHEE